MLLTRVKIQFLDRKERNEKKELKRKNSSLLQLDRSIFFSFETGRTNFFLFIISQRDTCKVWEFFLRISYENIDPRILKSWRIRV